MNPEQFKQKYNKREISDFLYRLDTEADHSGIPEEAEFLRDMYSLLLKMFPDCDPYE
jgi:hypothetical protein